MADASFDVQQLVARFANSLDLKDWSALAACLAAEVHTDYSELRGTPPQTLSREHFVALRQAALQPLRTHHLAGNVEIAFTADDAAQVMVSMAIFRRSADGRTLDTHCIYQLGVRREARGWLIDSIVQKVLINDGDTAIHAGITQR